LAANFALGLYRHDIGQDANQAFQQGQQTYLQNTARNAMAVLARDPNNQGAFEALAKVSPETAMQFRQQQQEQVKAQLAQHQDSILKGAEILRQFQPKDQATYSQALAAAQAAGIDISQVPQQFDPAYVDGVVKIADAFKPQTGQQPRFIPFQQGGGVVRVNPDGTTSMVIQPNPGDQQPGAPVGGAPVTATGPNGEKIQLNPQTGQWEPMGGGASNGTGGFP
jgi:hypothetical protein